MGEGAEKWNGWWRPGPGETWRLLAEGASSEGAARFQLAAARGGDKSGEKLVLPGGRDPNAQGPARRRRF